MQPGHSASPPAPSVRDESPLPRVEGEAAPTPDRAAKIIFVAGCSFSGSTLVGLILGSQPGIRFAGELKDYCRRDWQQSPGNRSFCSCGAGRDECEFWGPVQRRYGLEVDLNPAPGVSWANLLLFLRILTGLGSARESDTPHGSLVKAIHGVAHGQNPDVEYVVDSSKSLRNLDAISRTQGVEVYVIHLIRDGMGVGESYQKRGFGLLRGLTAWSLVNLLVDWYVKKQGIRTMRLDYRSLCLDTEAALNDLSTFLGTEVTSDSLVQSVRETSYHIVSGNGKVRRSAVEFQGVRYSKRRSETRGLGRLASALVVRPLNRRLGVVDPVDPGGAAATRA